MCIFCKAGLTRRHFGPYSRRPLATSRRDFLTRAVAAGAGLAGANLFAPRSTLAQSGSPPSDTGSPGARYVIRGGSVMTMDGGEYPEAGVVVEGRKIVAVGPGAGAGVSGHVIDATERIVMPGFIDTHHHQFETALRSFLADGVLILDGVSAPEGAFAYYTSILLGFAPVYRPQDVYISELFGGLSSSTTASLPCTTSRRSITRRSTPMRPSRRCSTQGAAPRSAISRAPARASTSTRPDMPIRRTLPASRTSGFRHRNNSSI